ncbi:MAG: FG-GAP repeat domain-containing protein, partial [Gaiellaceae bacterium]
MARVVLQSAGRTHKLSNALRPVILASACSVLLTTAAPALVQLLPGPQRFVGNRPERIAAAGVNGDGLLDAAVTHPSTGMVSILFGNGDGSFVARRTIRVARDVEGLAVRDLDGDGRVDIAAVTSLDRRLLLLRGRGDGTFASARRYPVGRNPVDLAVGSFTRAGATDIAVANSGNKTVQVFENVNGKAFFRPLGEYALDGVPQRVIAVDLDNDGLDDLVVLATDPTGGQDDVSVFLNKGDGRLASPTSFIVAAGGVDVAKADVNGDGKPDLLVLSAQPIYSV